MVTATRGLVLAVLAFGLALAGCGGGEGGGGTHPATLSISGTVGGAIAAGVKVSLSGASTATTRTDASGRYSFSGLGNGTYSILPSWPGYAFSPARPGALALNGADVAGQDFTAASIPSGIYDTMSGPTLDGALYTSPLQSRKIQGGALAIQVIAADLEPDSIRGVRPSSALSWTGSATSRVTSWQATITVPAAPAVARTGATSVMAAIALLYQPVANRLSYPGALAKAVRVEFGLRDTGTGLRLFRSLYRCTSPSCSTTDGSTNIAYANGTLPVDQAASPGTPYTFLLSFDETSGVFTYTVSGAGLTGTGTADARAMFTDQGLDPVADFYSASLLTRAFDTGATGGGSGTILGLFDDVYRGLNGNVATLYDAFGGTAIDLSKWTSGEATSALVAGALELTPSATGPAGSTGYSAAGVGPSSFPAGATQIKVDATIVSESSPGAGAFRLWRSFYNDGTPTGTAPSINQPYSGVGDVGGMIVLTSAGATFQVSRGSGASSYSFISSSIGNALNVSPGHPLGLGTTHTLAITWDPVAHTMTYQLDDATPVVVDPTTTSDPHMVVAAPVVRAKNVNLTSLFASVTPPPGTSASATVRLNNLAYAQ